MWASWMVSHPALDWTDVHPLCNSEAASLSTLASGSLAPAVWCCPLREKPLFLQTHLNFCLCSVTSALTFVSSVVQQEDQVMDFCYFGQKNSTPYVTCRQAAYLLHPNCYTTQPQLHNYRRVLFAFSKSFPGKGR